MSIIGQNILAGASGQGEAYTIDQSVRVDSDDSAFMDQSWSSSGDLQSWTFSAWVKRGKTGSSNFKIFGGRNSATLLSDMNFNADDIDVSEYVSGSTVARLTTNAVYRDPAAWYHIVVVWDSDNVTSGDRYRLYVNGERVTSFSTETYPSSGQASATNYVGSARLFKQDTDEYYDGYCAEVYFIDGQSLTADTFGETNAPTGQWVPKSDTVVKAAVTFGNNGFLTQFGTASSLGLDTSGEGNDFTTLSGFAASDQMPDSPTNNFATFNSIVKPNVALTYSEGNLKLVAGGGWSGTVSTIGSATGKWYMEYLSGTSNSLIGVNGASSAPWWNGTGNPQDDTTGTVLYYGYDGSKRINNVDTTYGDTYGNGDIIGIALNLDDSEITFYKNGTVQNSGTAISFPANLISQSLYTFGFATYSATNYGNFGQDSTFAGNKTAQGNQDENGIGDFYYAVPSGYLALCTSNLSDPENKLPGDNFNTVLYSGTGVSNAITGVGFQPDLIWLKTRESGDHWLSDVMQTFDSGGSPGMRPNTNDDQDTYVGYGVSAVGSDGFTVIGNGGLSNGSTNTYAAWNWKAGGASSVTNDDGSIESQVSANTTAGFSIFTYTGTGAAGTVGHGLSTTPELIIYKGMNTTSDWAVYHEQPDGTLGIAVLNTDAAVINSGFSWNSTVFTFASGSGYSNTSGTNYIAYAFNSVEGYSKIGHYKASANADGPFAYTGFRPAFVILKNMSRVLKWIMLDDKRNPYNVVDIALFPNDSAAEASLYNMDFDSNGFKIKTGSTSFMNHTSGDDYWFIAFAEFPFKYSNAR